MVTDSKACSVCKVVKPLDEYFGRSKAKDGKQSYCKDCQNRKRRQWGIANPEKIQGWRKSAPRKPRTDDRRFERFKMTPDDYDSMFAAQGGVCAACGRPPGKHRLQVDHDHACCDTRVTCGRCVRGLLCFNCNAALGHVQDDKERLMKLIEYLDGTPNQCSPQFGK